MIDVRKNQRELSTDSKRTRDSVSNIYNFNCGSCVLGKGKENTYPSASVNVLLIVV
jgi:hypothetical protein